MLASAPAGCARAPVDPAKSLSSGCRDRRQLPLDRRAVIWLLGFSWRDSRAARTGLSAPARVPRPRGLAAGRLRDLAARGRTARAPREGHRWCGASRRPCPNPRPGQRRGRGRRPGGEPAARPAHQHPRQHDRPAARAGQGAARAGADRAARGQDRRAGAAPERARDALRHHADDQLRARAERGVAHAGRAGGCAAQAARVRDVPVRRSSRPLRCRRATASSTPRGCTGAR